MTRSRHPDKHIERAVQCAEGLGWTLKKGRGHAWGILYCPQHDRSGCKVIVYSTPRVPENHARHIIREVDKCPHAELGRRHAGDENE